MSWQGGRRLYSGGWSGSPRAQEKPPACVAGRWGRTGDGVVVRVTGGQRNRPVHHITTVRTARLCQFELLSFERLKSTSHNPKYFLCPRKVDVLI